MYSALVQCTATCHGQVCEPLAAEQSTQRSCLSFSGRKTLNLWLLLKLLTSKVVPASNGSQAQLTKHRVPSCSGCCCR